MYFNKFPTTEYDFKTIGIEGLEVLDILTRVRFLFNDVFTGRAYTKYQIKHGDTPDIIAHKHYGNSDWWWLVLLYNDIVNPFNEIPRMGFDNKTLPGDYPNSNPVVYLERIDGDGFDDFKEGDILVKIRDDRTSTLSFSTSASQSVTQPQPLQPSNADFATAKIVKWRGAFREATLSNIIGDNFYAGDRIGVLKKENNQTSLKYWGLVVKSFPNSSDSISHIIENDSGREVHPQLDVQTSNIKREVKPTGPLVKRGDSANAYDNTLINAVLGGSGSSGTTYSNRYTAVTRKEIFDDYSLKSIKLLEPEYKEQARDLLNTLLVNRDMTYSTFTNTTPSFTTTNFINLPSTGNGNGNNITTIY